MSLEFTGLNELNAKLAKLGAQSFAVVEAGVFETAELVIGRSKELCPVDHGILRKSGYAITQSMALEGAGSEPARELLADAPDVVVAVVGHGGPAIPYALVQHERTDFHHEVGQAKYLETALHTEGLQLMERIAVRVNRQLAGST